MEGHTDKQTKRMATQTDKQKDKDQRQGKRRDRSPRTARKTRQT
jgi:hypothetical protein